MEQIFALLGIPSAVFGLFIWVLKRYFDKRERHHLEREKSREELMLMIVKSTRENTKLCIAIAKAVQRIPEAHCNGDMSEALKQVEKANREEKEFLINHGVQHIFE
jgi:hypothetical protein